MDPTTSTLLGQIGLGAIIGYSAGYATQKAVKILLVILGLLFVSIQILAYYGFVDVHWGTIQNAADPILNQSTVARYWDQFMAIMKTNLPFAGSFSGFFFLGLRAR